MVEKRGLETIDLVNFKISPETRAEMILNCLSLRMVNNDPEFRSIAIVGMPNTDWYPNDGASEEEKEKCYRENEERRQTALLSMRKSLESDKEKEKFNSELWERKYVPMYYHECGVKGVPLDIALAVYHKHRE